MFSCQSLYGSCLHVFASVYYYVVSLSSDHMLHDYYKNVIQTQITTNLVTHSDCSFCTYRCSLFLCSLALSFLLLLSAIPVQLFPELYHSSAVSIGGMGLCYCSIFFQLIVFCMHVYGDVIHSLKASLTVFSQVRSISSNIAGGIQPIQVRFNFMVAKLSYHVIIIISI